MTTDTPRVDALRTSDHTMTRNDCLIGMEKYDNCLIDMEKYRAFARVLERELALLLKYARHKKDCRHDCLVPGTHGQEYDACSCGLAELLARYKD